MFEENLFQLISKGDVVLFVGAGLSLYAGLPSGNQLSEFLYEGLSKQEKKIINSNLNLSDLAEEIYRIKGNTRNYIIQKLQEKILLNKFSSISTHENISKIPHFRDIITTNYDQLFEESFKSKLNIIYSDQQVAYSTNNKVNLFKIHGDLSVPDSIIITKSDYDNFFSNNKSDSVLWNVIKERISTKNILFVGYNLEDSNIAVIFDKISKNLGSNRKECFFVSPNIPPHKMYHLSGKNIHYIDSTGEELFSELIQYLKDNIKKNYENKLISTEIYSEFIRNFNVKSEVEVNESNNIVKSFSGITSQPETIAKFVISSDSPDFDKMLNLSKGEYLDDMVIDKSAFSTLDLRIEGIKVSDLDDIKHLKIMPIPSFDKKVDVLFENDIEIGDVEIKFFPGITKSKLFIKYFENEFHLDLNFVEDNSLKFKVNYINAKKINNVSKQLTFYKGMHHLTLGKMFDVYNEGNLIFTTKEKFDVRILQSLNGLHDYNLFYFKYFKKLKEIELLCKIKFFNIEINDITDENDLILDKIISKFKKIPIEQNFKGIFCKVSLTENNNSILKDFQHHAVPIKLEGFMKNVNIHNCEFELGKYEIHIVDPVILNFDSILEGSNEKMRIESSTDKALVFFK